MTDLSILSEDTRKWLVPQGWESYTETQHETWNTLFNRQMALVPGRVTDDFLQGVEQLKIGATGIPNIEETNKLLYNLTGWQIVCVEGKIPDIAFFDLLANRFFPSGNFIREPNELDYIEAPDIFHDMFGHVPMLTQPVFADYIQAYGQAGLRAESLGGLDMLNPVFWFTVEFGLMNTPDGMRIYGSGIVSSFSETQFCLESDSPNHLQFDLRRSMKTDYFIDDFQPTYFVIDSYEDLYKATEEDFKPIYDALRDKPLFKPGKVVDGDNVLQKGTQSYFLESGKEHKLEHTANADAA